MFTQRPETKLIRCWLGRGDSLSWKTRQHRPEQAGPRAFRSGFKTLRTMRPADFDKIARLY